jgi:hypothetical protein
MAVGLPLKTTYANGDVYSAGDVNDTNGTINITAAPYAAGKNKIINGDFRFNQRNWTSSTASGTYGYDRWKQINSDGTVTMSAQAFTPGTAPVAGYEASNFMRIVTSGQSSVNAFAFPLQPIEDVRTLAGQTITISFWAKAGSGTPKVAIEMDNSYGTGGSPSSAVQTYFGQVTLSTSWARYSVTGTMPTLTGKTLGTTANTSATFLDLWVSGGSTFNSRTGSLGIQNNTFDFWGVQVEYGSTATAFQTATGTIQGELAACQRYFNAYGDTAINYYPFTIGLCSPSNIIDLIMPLPVQMRIAPSLTNSTTYSNYYVSTGSSTPTITNITMPFASPKSVSLQLSAICTAGNAARFYQNTTNNGYLHFSAEL